MALALHASITVGASPTGSTMKKFIVIPKTDFDFAKLGQIPGLVVLSKNSYRATVEFDGCDEKKCKIKELFGKDCLVEEVQQKSAL